MAQLISDQRAFNELLQYYAMERFLYRLSQSEHTDRFILKGAMMLRAWQSPGVRPTMDIDFLGRTINEEAAIAAKIRDILAVAIKPDGLVFDPASIQTERITEDADYEGIRVRFRGALDTARVHMQIDIGFGDIVYPGAEESDLPTLLDDPAPRLLCYSRESAIAEKFESLGLSARTYSRILKVARTIADLAGEGHSSFRTRTRTCSGARSAIWICGGRNICVW